MFKPLHAVPQAGFAANPRFTLVPRTVVEVQPEEPAPAPPDPVAEAFEQGFAQGYDAARADCAEAEAGRDAAREAITLAFVRLDDAAAQDMAERLRQTVLALCEQAVLPLALDPHGLATRIATAVSLLQRAADERRVLIHPDDLDLVRPHLPPGLVVEADATVERGALRIETPDGGVEDGPAQWRHILAEAFDAC